MTEYTTTQQHLKDPNTSPEVLDQIAMHKNTGHKVGVANHPNVSVDTLGKLMRSKNCRVRRAVAKSPKLNHTMATFLLQDTSIAHPRWGLDTIHMTLAANPNTPSEILSELLVHPKDEVREHLAENPSLTQEQLAVLCLDRDWEVRFALVSHHSFLLWVSVSSDYDWEYDSLLIGYLP